MLHSHRCPRAISFQFPDLLLVFDSLRKPTNFKAKTAFLCGSRFCPFWRSRDPCLSRRHRFDRAWRLEPALRIGQTFCYRRPSCPRFLRFSYSRSHPQIPSLVCRCPCPWTYDPSAIYFWVLFYRTCAFAMATCSPWRKAWIARERKPALTQQRRWLAIPLWLRTLHATHTRRRRIHKPGLRCLPLPSGAASASASFSR